MLVDGVPCRTIGLTDDASAVEILDQTELPHAVVRRRLETLAHAAEAIRVMRVRGAPLIGATAAFGLWLALRHDPTDPALEDAARTLLATRPTGVNLRHAVEDGVRRLRPLAPAARPDAAQAWAVALCDEDIEINRGIGEHGCAMLQTLADRTDGAVQILTHCNAGALATVDLGTATAPIYRAHEAGVPLHVWVDETRPRNQGAGLTAWELGQAGVPHTVIVDNAGGHLMRAGRVHVCLVGTDRTTGAGDVANKIGTYLKALAAHDNGIPFYVAVPSPSIDWSLRDGDGIPIEERDGREVSEVWGLGRDGRPAAVRVTPADTAVLNVGFDITPARLITGLVTERGICAANPEGLRRLFPERAP